MRSLRVQRNYARLHLAFSAGRRGVTRISADDGTERDDRMTYTLYVDRVRVCGTDECRIVYYGLNADL